jgi:enterochelin esterase family protein
MQLDSNKSPISHNVFKASVKSRPRITDGSIVTMSAAAPDPDAFDTLFSDPESLNAQLNLLWFGCGKDDFLLERNTAFIEKLERHGIDHEWLLTEGGHNWPVWRNYLSQLLPKLFKK